MSRATVYDKDTGLWIRTGGLPDPKTQALIADGHIVVELSYSPFTKWDFATSSVVEDTDKVNNAEAKETKRKELRQRWGERRAALIAKRGSITALPEVIEAIEELIDMLEVPEDTI